MKRTRWFLVVGAVIALVLAGIVSFYASDKPDGLERVAEDQGFARAEQRHAAGDSPFADYGTEAVDDERVSVGLAGIAGTVTVLALAGGLTYLVRWRSRAAASEPD